MRLSALRRIAGPGLALALLLTVAACGKKAPVEIAPEIASSDEALFKLGEEAIKKDEEKGMLFLRQLMDSFPKSFYAQRAKLLIADAYFKKADEGNLILAASEYREFINLYPFSPSAAYCQYQIGMTFYKKTLKPGRDQTKTAQALAELKKTVSTYPTSEQAKAAQEKIKDCEERLAEHQFLIGSQYLGSRAYKAATSRLAEILTAYPNFSGMDRVYFSLGDAYFLGQKNAEAVPYFTKLVSDYPRSPLVRKAQERLKEIEAAPKAKPPVAK
jgi:outer membrane protein assembly factor BamD